MVTGGKLTVFVSLVFFFFFFLLPVLELFHSFLSRSCIRLSSRVALRRRDVVLFLVLYQDFKERREREREEKEKREREEK